MKSKLKFAMEPTQIPKTYIIESDNAGMFILCRSCKQKSYNINDIVNRYCFNCNAWHYSPVNEQDQIYFLIRQQRDKWREYSFVQMKWAKRYKLLAIIGAAINLFWTAEFLGRMYATYFLKP